MVATPSRTQSITMYTNRQIMQPTLGFRLKISTSEVRNKGVMQTLHRSWRRGCRSVRNNGRHKQGTKNGNTVDGLLKQREHRMGEHRYPRRKRNPEGTTEPNHEKSWTRRKDKRADSKHVEVRGEQQRGKE